MHRDIHRRDFIRIQLGAALCVLGGQGMCGEASKPAPKVVSPGCRRSRLKVARLFIGVPKAHYPNPAIDPTAEMASYRQSFDALRGEFADVDFVPDELVSSPGRIAELKEKIAAADGVLVVHLTLHTMPILKEVLALGRPTVIFSPPYAGHEWFELSAIRREKLGSRMECILTADRGQLAAAVRPFRAMHHLREGRVLNLAASTPAAYAEQVRAKFGTEIRQVPLDRALKLYEGVSDGDARAEAERWTKGALAVVEPSADEVFRSCKLALALEKLLDEEDATILGVDCYGSMWRKLPAYPCIAFTRLNDMGLGGICQSDLPCAMVHGIFQGLTGRPGFVCNPTFDFVANGATLIHCLGSTRMDGPGGAAAPYRLRSIMEREEGAVPQVFMRAGERVTVGMLAGVGTMRYFTGAIASVPDTERGCRTQINVKVDGDAEKLWRNWSAGIHRVACYGDVTRDLERFCRFAGLEFLNEAV